MLWSLRKARALFGAWVSLMTAYRAEIVIWMLSGTVPLIMMAVWIGKAAASGGEIGGFDATGFAAYFLAAWLAQQLTVAWVAWELDQQIRLGHLSARLLRPIDPLWDHVMAHVSEKVVRTPFIALALAAGALIVPGTRLTPDVWHALAFLACIALAFWMRFLISYSVGLLAFWLDESTSLDEFYWVLQTFLAGGFAPLSFYPPVVQALVEWTPFPYIVYYPVRVLTGEAPWPEVARIVAVQVAWVVGLMLVRALLWSRGLRRYGAFGA